MHLYLRTGLNIKGDQVKRITVFILSLIMVFMFSGIVFAGTTVTLAWDANSETDLAGYKIYQDGEKVADIQCLANDESCSTWTSGLLTEGDHSWYATAFDNDQNESGPSNTVSHRVDLTAPNAPTITITIKIDVVIE